MKAVQSKVRVTLGTSLLIGLSVLMMLAPRDSYQSVSAGTVSQSQARRSAQVRVSHAELPLSFEPNLGQSEPQVKFLSRGNGYKLFLTADEAVLLLKNSTANKGTRNPKLGATHSVLAMRLVGANRGAAVTGIAKFPGTSNYFIGNDPTKWHVNVPTYAKVQYENIYPGVDLVYYGNQNRLEYDFVVAPGTDPGQINLAFEVQPHRKLKFSRARLDGNGNLVLDVGGQEVRFHKPVVYQLTSKPEVRTAIEGGYLLKADNQVGFEVGPYDRNRALVIDPVLSYSSYLGGNEFDSGYGLAVDSSGNILVAGTTASTNFPTDNAFQSQNAGSNDAFVTKFNPSGTSIIYSTYIGGSNFDQCEALALNSAGNAFITGYTSSEDFPTKNPIQASNAGAQNIFVTQLDPNGNLLSSTYYGGSNTDNAYGIAVDSSGIYVVGNTNSKNYPIENAFQSKLASNQDSFLTKFTPNVSAVLYSTYLGGAGGASTAYSVAVDSSESPYLVGQTHSASFPTLNAFQSQDKNSAGTVFLTKFTPSGTALAYSTYLGGSNTESAGSVTVDASGNAYVAGGTASTDFPTLNPVQAKNAGEYDVFVAKFNSSGNALIYSTYIGGSYNEFGDAITVDSLGNAYVAGYVFSPNFPITANAFQPQNGGAWNAFVLELNSAGNGLIYSSYLGGSLLDYADSIALDLSGNVWLSGGASSTNFPVTGNAFQSTFAGGSDDAYLAQVSAVTTFPLTVSLAGAGTGTVTSSPVGINCGQVCSATFISGPVTLTATASPGAVFTGWSGACSGLGVCNVDLTSVESVTATFGLPTFSVLTNFGTNGGNDPLNPTWPGLIAQGQDGNLYSTAPTDLNGSSGAVFNITPSGVLNVLTTGFAAGAAPQSGLTLGSNGNFYGTTYGCGVGGNGTIFQFVASTSTINELYSFTGGKDGKCPTAPPIQGVNGNLYGTTTSSNTAGIFGSAYEISTSGTGFLPLHDFGGTNGASPAAPLVQATSAGTATFYGVAQQGGSTGLNDGIVFDMSQTGAFNVLYTFNGTTGQNPVAPLVQGSDGSLYGTTKTGGTYNLGVLFKITIGGSFTILHNFAGNGDGAYPYGGMVAASDGNLYGTTSQATASSGCGTVFRLSSGVLGTLFTFPSNGSSGCNPMGALIQHTNGTIFGATNTGGSTQGGAACPSGCGTFFSLNADLPPFVALLQTSGKVGSTVEILGQGFEPSSAVAFNGVPASTVTVTGTTYLTATVPAGASTGFVSVTTGGTTLTSLVKFVVHNSWSSGMPIPTPVAAAAAGSINGNIYVVGGFQTNGGGPVNNNQVYNTASNTWTTAAPIPTPVYGAASAVVGNNLFVIGGFETSSGTATNLVQQYNTRSNSWSSVAAMPTARGGATAVVDTNTIFVIGGAGSSGPLNNVEQYTPSSNTWAEEAPLLTAKYDLSAALLKGIVAADGVTASGDTGDNELYNDSNNTWSSLIADPNPRNSSCFGGLSQLYIAGGLNNGAPQTATTLSESFNMVTNEWTTLDAMPTAAFGQASALANGLLYCVGGQTSQQGAAINNVQIYQP